MDIGSWATAAGVLLAAGSLELSRKQARTGFEDALAREYREIAQQLPVKSLLGEQSVPAAAIPPCLSEFYRYIDLTNEQIYLRSQGRIRRSTWRDWRAGIEGNFRRPDFLAAWRYIEQRAPNDFHELRRLEKNDFRGDPRLPLWHRLRLEDPTRTAEAESRLPAG